MRLTIVAPNVADHTLTHGRVRVDVGTSDATLVSAVDPNGPTLTTSWTSSGLTHTVSTPKKVGESPTAQVQRHGNMVSAFTAAFPPDPPQ